MSSDVPARAWPGYRGLGPASRGLRRGKYSENEIQLLGTNSMHLAPIVRLRGHCQKIWKDSAVISGI